MQTDKPEPAVTTYRIEDGVAVIMTDRPPVNALSHAVLAGLAQALQRAGGDPAVTAIAIACEGRTFHAGADISAIGDEKPWPQLRDVQAEMRTAGKPVVAAIHGTTLGGGLELALVAHVRIAAASTRLGLPEVKLGIVPGAGGTQRLARAAGPELALDLVSTGRQASADEALEAGIVDEVVPDGEQLARAIVVARALGQAQGLPEILDVRQDKIMDDGSHSALFERFRAINAKKFRGFHAPEFAVRCIEAAVHLPFEEGLAAERAYYEELRNGPQAPALRYLFFAERKATKLPPSLAGSPVRPIATVGVIGAGTMGGGIAMNFLSAGIQVTLVEREPEALERGIGIIRANYHRGVKGGRMTAAEVDAAIGLLRPTTDMAEVAGCDLVIEAVFEDILVKQAVFQALDRLARSDAILATNTSYLDLDAIASFTRRPQSVVGMHFFSPANVMRLLEVVRGRETAPQVLATVSALAKRIGKVGVTVGNCFGFVGNRILAQRQNQAEQLILEGAMPWDVDRVLYEFGFAMGPFQMRDLVGLDVGWNRETTSSSTVREILNERGRHGRKSGAGYYDFDAAGNSVPSDQVMAIIGDVARKRGVPQRVVTDEEICARCLYPMVNEAAKIWEEGVVDRPSDIDVIWTTGYGWPAYRGGPVYWGEREGLSRIALSLREMLPLLGEDFTISPLLERLTVDGRGFAEI